jgi:hypothetical protein
VEGYAFPVNKPLPYMGGIKFEGGKDHEREDV